MKIGAGLLQEASSFKSIDHRIFRELVKISFRKLRKAIGAEDVFLAYQGLCTACAGRGINYVHKIVE
jgi:hypothetical protein